MEIESLDSADTYALGGYSADRDTLIRMMFGQDPTSEMVAWFEEQSKKAGVAPGPMWLEGEPLRRVLTRIERRIQKLKALRTLQAATTLSKTSD